MIAFYIGFVVFLGTLYFQGYFFSILEFTGNLFWEKTGGTLIFVMILLILFQTVSPKIKEINRDNERCLRIIDESFIKIDDGLSLPSLMELQEEAFPKKRRRWLKTNQTKGKNDQSHMSNEDREFLRVQTDVQIWIAMTVGCFAAMIASLVGETQSYLSTKTFNLEVLVLLFVVVFFGALTGYCAYRTDASRRKMDDF